MSARLIAIFCFWLFKHFSRRLPAAPADELSIRLGPSNAKKRQRMQSWRERTKACRPEDRQDSQAIREPHVNPESSKITLKPDHNSADLLRGDVTQNPIRPGETQVMQCRFQNLRRGTEA